MAQLVRLAGDARLEDEIVVLGRDGGVVIEDFLAPAHRRPGTAPPQRADT